jgi:hypothetical protein
VEALSKVRERLGHALGERPEQIRLMTFDQRPRALVSVPSRSLAIRWPTIAAPRIAERASGNRALK